MRPPLYDSLLFPSLHAFPLRNLNMRSDKYTKVSTHIGGQHILAAGHRVRSTPGVESDPLRAVICPNGSALDASDPHLPYLSPIGAQVTISPAVLTIPSPAQVGAGRLPFRVYTDYSLPRSCGP